MPGKEYLMFRILEDRKLNDTIVLQVVEASQTHWLERPIVPNGLRGRMEELFQNNVEWGMGNGE